MEPASPEEPPPQSSVRFFIVGPTASGKGRLACALAERVGGEIISVDSMKIYRRMDIGTAKPSEEVRRRVRFHALDVHDPGDPGEWSVASWVELAGRAEQEIRERGHQPIYCGGTALYVKALTEGLFEGPSADQELRARLKQEAAATGREALHERLREVDPDAAGRIHPNDLRRVVRALEVYQLTGTPLSALQIQWEQERHPRRRTMVGIARDREDLYRRINRRVDRMFAAGFLQEVLRLYQDRALGPKAAQALGYRELMTWLEEGAGPQALPGVIEDIKQNTRRFAKQQLTWWRRFEDIDWLEVAPDEDLRSRAEEVARRYFPHRLPQ